MCMYVKRGRYTLSLFNSIYFLLISRNDVCQSSKSLLTYRYIALSLQRVSFRYLYKHISLIISLDFPVPPLPLHSTLPTYLFTI